MKRAIKNLKLEAANQAKLTALDAVAQVYVRAVQRFVTELIERGEREPDKFGGIPADAQELIGPPSPESQLSERWRRCAWQQACGVVQSWFANERTKAPELNPTDICIQCNANVVKLERQGAPQQAALQQLEAKRREAEREGKPVRMPKTLPDPSRGRHFAYWLKIATLDAGNPVWVPLALYPRAVRMLAGSDRVAGSVLLNRRSGVWHAQLVVEGKPPDRRAEEVSQVVGIDVGITAFATVSPTHRVTAAKPTPESDRPVHERFGGVPRPLAERIERDTKRFRRKQKLNACLRRKHLPEVPLGNLKTTAWVRNLIGFALNQVLFWLPDPEQVAVAVEDLSVAGMRFKSKAGNRLLKVSQLGFLRDRLQDKLAERGYRVKAVNPAFSSQECAACGFVSRVNRPSHSEFQCDWCQFQINADCNASDVVAKRFGDTALNQLSVPRTGEVLLERFLARHQLLLRPLTPSSP